MGSWARKLTDWELEKVVQANRRLKSPRSIRFTQITSFLFSPTVWNVCPVILALIALVLKETEFGVLLIASSLQCVLVQYSIKMIVKRKRPYSRTDEISSFDKHTDPYCFPSGHAMFFVHFWMVIGLWFGVPSAIIFALIGGIYVGLTRIFLGVHFLTDVIVGYLLAIFSAYILVAYTFPLWFLLFGLILDPIRQVLALIRG